MEGKVGPDNTRQYNDITWTDMESTSQKSCHDIVLVGKASPSTTSDAKCDPKYTQERFHLDTTTTTTTSIPSILSQSAIQVIEA